MEILSAIIQLLGGLAMFLYGIELMGDGLKNSSGEALKRVLEKITGNVLMGVLTGALVTAAIQSSTATIVPLVVAAAPFVARVVESSLKEVDAGIIEAAQSMGTSTFGIVWKVLLPEAKPSLITGATIAITTILGYSAMAGFVGGGGLGTIAINYGYYRKQTDIMLITVLFLVVIVQLFQEIGMRIMKRSDKRIRN